MSTLILVALICLISGVVIGFLLTKTLHPQQQLRRELEEELARVRDEHKTYQQEVTEHFARTADLVGNLAQNFHAVHEQLANSAMQLASPEVSRKLMEAASRSGLGTGTGVTLGTMPPDPPRDYAPKVPGGVLSEHYGLDLDQDTASRTARTASQSVSVTDNTVEAEARNDEDEDPTLKVG